MIAITLVVLLYGILLQQTCLADGNYGYFLYNIQPNPCTTEPSSMCGFDHEVAIMNEGTRNTTQNIVDFQQKIQGLERNSSDALCLKAMVDYHCKMMFPINCTDNYLLYDKKGLENLRKKVRLYCVNDTGMMESFKATMNKTMPTASTKPFNRKIVQCERFSNINNDQDWCPKRNYKVRLHVLCMKMQITRKT